MKYIIYFLLSSLLFPINSMAQMNSCEEFTKSSKVSFIQTSLASLKQQTSNLWPGYDLSKTSIYFIDQKNYNGCILKMNDGGVEASTLTSQVLIPNNLYSFCGSLVNQTCPDNKDVEAGVVYRLDNILDSLSSLGVDPVKIDYTAVAHESFHLIGQSLGAKKFGWWNNFKNGHLSSSESRDEIAAKCYGLNETIFSETKNEITLLQKIFKSVIDKSADIKTIKSEAKIYIQNRNTRLDQLNKLSVNVSKSTSCAEAESYMEFLEGIAEFVGLQTSIDSGAMSKIEVADWIGRALDFSKPPGEYFYRTGALMLLIVKNVDPVSYQKIVTNITLALHSDETVFFEFNKWTENL
jgi:hypothetical protein